MNTKSILTLAIGAVLALASTSVAAPHMWSKATGNYDDSMSHRPTASARRTYRSTAPRTIQAAPAPEAVASAPATTRRYSYDSSAAKANASQETAKAPSVARSTRRFSYEPAARSYSGTRRSGNSHLQQTLPKTDPRKFNF